MWSQITLKTKVIKHRLIMCQCEKCGKKKWSQRRKKSNKVLSLIVINACIWLPLFDGLTASQVMVFENTTLAEVAHASEIPNTDSPVTDGIPGHRVVEVSSVADTLEVDHASPVQGSVIEVIKRVGRETDTDWRLLYSICQVESHCIADRIGDNGKSYGAFQIFQPVHKGTSKLAFDLEWSARWTAEHGKDYKDNPAMFFKKHNGIAKTTNQWYIDRCMEIYKTL